MNPTPSQSPSPPAKNQSAGSILRGKGYKAGIKNLVYAIFLRLLYASERIGGAAVVSRFMAPIIGWDMRKRQRDYPLFVQLRNALPPDFWKGIGPEQHYLNMIRGWHEMLGTMLLYHRLGLTGWQKRFQVKGTPPHALPEWGRRPMILAFLHTGTFGLNRYWMRSQGIPCTSLIDDLPPVLVDEHHQKIQLAGDLRYGLEGVPQTFKRPAGLRDAIRFLKPGHALTVALDGGKVSPDMEHYDAGGLPIIAKNGACRIAAQTNAMVIPVSVRRTGACRFEIGFGKPVPDELIQKEDFTGATQHLISELWRDIRENPDCVNWTTLEALAPTLRGDRLKWP